MSENVVGPWGVDDALTASMSGATVLLNPADMAKANAQQFAAAAGRHGFVNGFTSPRNADNRLLVNAVLRFADPRSAKAAAAEFAAISLDPTGLLARTLPLPEDEGTPRDNITLGPHGALHFQRDATHAAELFAESGMDLGANGRTVVYQTKDADGAARIADGFYAEVQAESDAAAPVKNLPDSRCVEFSASWFYCLGVADRYAIEASSDTLLDAQQQVAAQYVMLFSD
jgi:hypothetical protein